MRDDLIATMQREESRRVVKGGWVGRCDEACRKCDVFPSTKPAAAMLDTMEKESTGLLTGASVVKIEV